MIKKARTPSLVLLADAENVAWLEHDGADASARVIASRAWSRSLESATAENARILVQEALAALPDHPCRSVRLVLPPTWVEHLVVTSPPLLRGLDRIAYLLREVTKRTSLEQNDVVFAECDTRADAAASHSARGKPIARLVIAARESSIVALVDALRTHRIEVTSIASGPASVFARELSNSAATGDPNENLEVLFFVQRSGFALCLHASGEIHQIRVVAVELPQAVDSLAESIAEEIRRSTVSAREKHWNRKVGQIRIVGRCSTDPSALRTAVETLTGLPTSVPATCDDDSDRVLEAVATAPVRRRESPRLDLLPKGGDRPRAGFVRIALASIVSCVALAGLIGVSKVIDEDTDFTQSVLNAGLESQQKTEEALSEYSAYLARLDAFDRSRAAIAALVLQRLDVSRIVRAFAAVIGPDCQISSIHGVGLVGSPSSIRVSGRFVESYWPYESNLQRLVADLARSCGMRFVPISDSSLQFTDDDQDFILETRRESVDEPSHP